jgi:transposase-like protein
MAKKKCINCGSFRVVKNGRTSNDSQLYLCRRCGSQFIRRYRSVKWQKNLFQEYIFGKKTLKQLADQHGKSIKTIRKYLDRYQVELERLEAKPIVVGMDCSFFGRGYGIILARCPNLK